MTATKLLQTLLHGWLHFNTTIYHFYKEKIIFKNNWQAKWFLTPQPLQILFVKKNLSLHSVSCHFGINKLKANFSKNPDNILNLLLQNLELRKLLLRVVSVQITLNFEESTLKPYFWMFLFMFKSLKTGRILNPKELESIMKI